MKKEPTHPTTMSARKIHPLHKKLRPSSDLIEYLRQYAHDRPEVVALCSLGVGFALGWKLKLW